MLSEHSAPVECPWPNRILLKPNPGRIVPEQNALSQNRILLEQNPVRALCLSRVTLPEQNSARAECPLAEHNYARAESFWNYFWILLLCCQQEHGCDLGGEDVDYLLNPKKIRRVNLARFPVLLTFSRLPPPPQPHSFNHQDPPPSPSLTIKHRRCLSSQWLPSHLINHQVAYQQWN
ncbi:hypothetical protein RJ639_002205 [Escallonia herrerae]|uniref:Uncharacterized protein n=1 Tax=Escallonia herrerae TaxID=1293975 RepID=A0AA89BF76_9ASTE|nr:hypothetical protein RJ639_002205 [Escallonia herrerae]